MTYAEILSHIYALGRFGIKPGLARVSRLLSALGNPHEAFATVHVAGTNGKGSSACTLSSILSASGYRTGLFTSPHLISFTERMRVDGREVAEADVVKLAERVLAAAPEGATFFEIVTALAALYFAEAAVDIAVFEAGMGGRSDATNALNGLLTLVSPISIDHTEYLGATLPEIALEKAGIVKPGTPVVSGRQLPEASSVLERACRELSAPLYCQGERFQAQWREDVLDYRGLSCSLSGLRPGLRGRYQSGNVACALAAAELLSGLGYPLQEQALVAGVEQARWPGRMELFPGPPRILLDGAHNPAGAAALVEALAELPRRRLLMVVGVMADKDLDGIVGPLAALADAVFAVAPALPRALAPAQLAWFCRQAGREAHEAGSVQQGLALARAAAGPDDLILVCGSLFTVGEARSLLLERHFEAFRG